MLISKKFEISVSLVLGKWVCKWPFVSQAATLTKIGEMCQKSNSKRQLDPSQQKIGRGSCPSIFDQFTSIKRSVSIAPETSFRILGDCFKYLQQSKKALIFYLKAQVSKEVRE